MIVLRCELWPKGDQDRVIELGRLTITNTGAGDVKRGRYAARLVGKESRLMGVMKLGDWPRLQNHVWDLVTVLLCMLRPKTVRRYRRLWES